MVLEQHSERHFTASDVVRDIVIGMSDGLTVPFALAAGLSGAVASSSIVVTAGLAELVAGSISMGLGGYLAARTEYDHYLSERRREFQEIEDIPEQEAAEIEAIFRYYGVPEEQLVNIVDAICEDPSRWADFMMRFELGLEVPRPERARWSALTIAASYFVGGLIPLCPYILIPRVDTALGISVLVTLVALFIFGYTKGQFTGMNPMRSGQQTILIGSIAALAAFMFARFISG